MARWMGLAADWLRPIYEQIRTGVMAGGYLQIDETRVRYLSPGILARGEIAKRTVRTTLAIFHGPAFQDNACFVQIAEEFAVEALIAQLVIKALNVSVLQGLPGLM